MRWIEKQKNILDFTLSSFFRRRGKNMALIVVYTVVIFSLASVMFFTYSIKQEAGLILKDAPGNGSAAIGNGPARSCSHKLYG